MEKFIVLYERKFEQYGIYIVFVPLMLMTIIQVLNAFGRKMSFPFPCALESVESLLVISVYFGVPIVALEGGHVNVTIATRRLPLSAKKFLDAFANLSGTLVFGYLAAGAWGEAAKSIGLLEMRIGVYRFPLWPFKTLFAVGMTLFTIQLAFNTIKNVYLGLGRVTYAGARSAEDSRPILETEGLMEQSSKS